MKEYTKVVIYKCNEIIKIKTWRKEEKSEAAAETNVKPIVRPSKPRWLELDMQQKTATVLGKY